MAETIERELTLRGLLLGAALTMLFTAANVFLGLRVGLTFATSIPAAVISMAVLRLVPGSGVLENNIVQTVASAAGALASIIFILPGLVMVGWWTGFPFWSSALLCGTGGVLGVMFSIPLRRALVTGSDLPFPEGHAAAEVLKVGSATGEHAARGTRAGFAALIFGSAMSAGYALLVALRLTVDEAAAWVRVRGGATGIDMGFSFALVGVGHLVGLSVGMALLLGLGLAFFIAVPVLSALGAVPGTAEAAALGTWSHQVRFIGAGVIGVAALWALAALVMPIARGLIDAAASSRARRADGGLTLPVEERDMPIPYVGAISAALVVPIAWLLRDFLASGPLAPWAIGLTVGGTMFVLVMTVVTASVCGYMAGLIGSSNSPLSGIGILAILTATLLLAITVAPLGGIGVRRHLVAFALFGTSIVFAAATVANDNLQDLKTGQLVGATPWKQQVALVVGSIAGAIAIPPVLNLLAVAYGFGEPSAAHPSPLPAPQALLLSALAKGVLGGDLDWGMIGIGAALGIALIGLDGGLGRAGRLRLPPLAVGIGMYLPMSATLPVVIGAVIGHVWERRGPAFAQIGVLMASGLIVGESLFGVLVAGLIVLTGSATPLAIAGPGFHTAAIAIGAAVFVAGVALCYARADAIGRGAPGLGRTR